MSRKAVAAKFQDEAYNITVIGRQVLVTDAMKDYALEKISKIERFNIRITDIDIVMDIQRAIHKVDVVLKVDHIIIRSEATSDNMYASIDKAIDKLQTQLRRYKDRIREHQAKDISTVEMEVKVLSSDLEDVNEEIEAATGEKLLDQYRPHVVASRETLFLKVLNQPEAIMKMELSGDAFLIYRAEEDRKLKVIYRRKDGNYGVIEPEK